MFRACFVIGVLQSACGAACHIFVHDTLPAATSDVIGTVWHSLNCCACSTQTLKPYIQNFAVPGTLKAFSVRNDLPARAQSGDEDAMLRLVLLLRDSAKGLAALHHQQVVHGDLVSQCYLVLPDESLVYCTAC